MTGYPPTVVLRHRRENLKKCSLRGLETRPDMLFFSYPKQALPLLHTYIILSMEGPVISKEDSSCGLFILDATWRYADVMLRSVRQQPHELVPRSLPASIRTAYPRRQDDCADPERGLASVEALYAAYFLLGRDTCGLLDNYHWEEQFRLINSGLLP